MADERYEDNIEYEDVDAMVGGNQNNFDNHRSAQALNNIVQDKRKDNFLHHQLATEEMLDKLEAFYRGAKLGTNAEGDVDWVDQADERLKPLNEYGVSSLMEIVTKYIDKNTILSYYNEIRIYEIIGDVGDEMVLFMLCNYEKMGMTTYEKKTKFRLIVTTTLHIIESTYRRALHGRTMEEINQAKVVGQFGDSAPQQNTDQPKKQGWAQTLGLR